MRPIRREPDLIPAVRVLAAAALAAGASRLPALRSAPALQRSNHRGAAVSLVSGPALALGVLAGTSSPLPAAATAVLMSAAVGAYDDAAGSRPLRGGAKGFRGHLAALRQGRVTAGTVKVAGIGVAGVLGAALLRVGTVEARPDLCRPASGHGSPSRQRSRGADALLGGAVVAGTANLLNLLDLRPGRALKVGGVLALLLGQPGVAAAAAALLPDDLAERTMLGDAGANALGAVLGLALLHRYPGKATPALTGLVALTAASEVVSFSRVIDATPPLRWLDRLGRRP